MATKRTAAQQKAIDDLRAKKAAAETVEPNEPKVASSTAGIELEQMDEEFASFKLMKDMAASMGLPSWKRALVSMIFGVCIGTGIAYGANMIVGIIMAGAVATTSYFLAMVLAVLAAIVGAYLALKYASRGFSYVANGSIDSDLEAAKNKVLGWFKSKPVAA